ncbi:hypothetical protein KSS93_12690 [Pseudomonas xanthosomatis]|uniref:hypothetical protein n=1 Tax=Pseudomonas xanthosomatis TaxID=2842356 RepID=UPI001C3D88DB|nr:hypothetical protein [Pseudomonas xanthosomatis]QXH48703.1 hypothetical protein KSS93_12690 [Pseudomonas xanthosomatis]
MDMNKLVIRSLQKILLKSRRDDIKVTGDLILREALSEKTLRRYLKAIGFATQVHIDFAEPMTVDELIGILRKP